MLDLIIRGGTVYDGTGDDGFTADVGICDGSIVEVGNLGSQAARHIISAQGKAVTPGFIDMHSHADCSVPMWPDMESALGQGITTCFAGHCGMSLAPVHHYWLEQCFEARAFDKIIPQFAGGPIPGIGRVVKTEQLRPAFREAYGEELDWGRFGEYLAHLKRVGHGANLAVNVGHSQLRQQILGPCAERAATPEEIRQMVRELDRCLDEGAFGLSLGLDYTSSMYAERDELAALMKTARTHGAVITAHMRTEPRAQATGGSGFPLFDSFEEFLELGVATGARLHISHIYTIADISPGKNADILAENAVRSTLMLIDRYRAKGVEVTWDYLGTQPAACFFFPQLATRFRPYVDECGGKQAFARALSHSWYRDAVANEIRSGGHRAVSPFAAMSKSAGGRWGANLILSRCLEKSFEGRSIGDIADELGLDCVDTAIEIMRRDPETMCDRRRDTDPAAGHYYVLDEDMSFGTDNGAHNYDFADQSGPDMPYVIGTPTEFGGMVEYFNTFHELPFQALVKRMTGNAAKALRLTDRGFIRAGMRADLLVLDLGKLRSNLNLAEPRTAPDGIDYVIVNGKIAVDHKRHLHPRSGQIILRPSTI